MSKSTSASASANAVPGATRPNLHGIRRGIATLALFALGMWFVHTLDWNPSWGNLFGTGGDVLMTTGIILVAVAVVALILVGLQSKSILLKLVAVVLISTATTMWRTVVGDGGMRILAVLAVLIVFAGLAYLAIKVDIRTAPEWSKAVQAVKVRVANRKAKAKAASAAAGTSTTGASAPQSA